jgi:predicted metal-dependent hydrolase
MEEKKVYPVFDIINVDDGEVRLIWPHHLSRESVEDFVLWIELLLKRRKRLLEPDNSNSREVEK